MGGTIGRFRIQASVIIPKVSNVKISTHFGLKDLDHSLIKNVYIGEIILGDLETSHAYQWIQVKFSTTRGSKMELGMRSKHIFVCCK